MTMRINNAWLTRLRQHPLWIAVAITVMLLGWVAAIGNSYIVEPVPTEDQIADQTVRLNESGLLHVTAQLERYRTPAETPTFTSNPFTGAP